ncbi:MAG: MazG-like family protein [Clostridiaceae bacterium]|nr:MazG-like family protein [Clostridiaceae bacterium]
MFQNNKNNSDISRNLKLIEILKCELLSAVSELFQTMIKSAKESKDAAVDCLVDIILITYTLGKRMGYDYSKIDKKMEEKIKTSILQEHHLEKWYGDLSELKEHLTRRRE